MCQLKDFDNLKVVDGSNNSTLWATFLKEELRDWHRWYLPSPDANLSGMGDIWDFGAGCGETAQFFLNHHAVRVMCVEMNPLALKYLHLNFDADPRVRIIESCFGWGKFDIERGEWGIRFEAHDSASGFMVIKKWNRESNTGIYGLKKSRLNTFVQTRELPFSRLHRARIDAAHRVRLVLNRF